MNSNTETIDLPHGYTAVIAQDDSPANPFNEWDGNPPMTTFLEGDTRSPGSRTEEITAEDLFDLIPAEAFAEQSNRVKILRAAEIQEAELADVLSDITDSPDPDPEDWRDALRELLPEVPAGYYANPGTYFDTMEALAGLAGIPYLRETSIGYSQGDFVEVFLAATTDWLEASGVAPENAEAALQAAFDVYTAWAWGDAYGVAKILRPDGTEVPDGACWGFFGTDHAESGLVGHCQSVVEHDMAARKREAAEAHDAACRDIATADAWSAYARSHVDALAHAGAAVPGLA